jgi:hypothetical protein
MGSCHMPLSTISLQLSPLAEAISLPSPSPTVVKPPSPIPTVLQPQYPPPTSISSSHFIYFLLSLVKQSSSCSIVRGPIFLLFIYAILLTCWIQRPTRHWKSPIRLWAVGCFSITNTCLRLAMRANGWMVGSFLCPWVLMP